MLPKKNIQLIECPRDAMQGWNSIIPTDKKAAYINALLHVGFDTLDFGSFVSAKAIPQMADTKDVLKALNLQHTKTKLLAIIANQRGAEEAIVFDEITFLGFPFSISPTFQQRNTNSTIEESFERVTAIQELCVKNNKQLVIYLSMGFGNPYGDVYNNDILLHWAGKIVSLGIKTISLADTVGLATPEQVSKALTALIPAYSAVNFGVHLHSTAENVSSKLKAALDAGCTRFDGALKGIGGCPMAQDDLVGNMPTELMISYFEAQGLPLNLNKEALQHCMQLANEIFT